MNQHITIRGRFAPMLYMSLAMAMWAIIDHIPGFFTQRYTTFQIVWMRYSVHLMFMLVVFGPRVKLRLVRTRRLGLQLVRGLLMVGMHLSFIFAIKYIPFKVTMAGFWVTPLLLLGLSAWWGEKSGKVDWAITLVSFGCILLILRPLDGLLHPGTLLSIGMALCFAIYMQMTRALSGEDLLASLFYTALSVWVILSLLMPFYWVTPNGWDMLLFVAIGLLGFVGIYGFDKAAESAPTWISAPFAMIQPIYLIGIDFGLRGINPGRLSLAAAGLVIACLGILTWRNKNLRSNTEVPHV